MFHQVLIANLHHLLLKRISRMFWRSFFHLLTKKLISGGIYG